MVPGVARRLWVADPAEARVAGSLDFPAWQTLYVDRVGVAIAVSV